MTPDEVKRARIALRLTQPQLAELLGLQPGNGDRTIRGWEDGTRPITGPAALALTYAAQGALDDVMRQVIPEYVVAEAMSEDSADSPEMVIRLHRPRFIAVVLPSDFVLPDADSAPIGAGIERLVVAMWIDDPSGPPGWDAGDLLARAAAAFEMHAADTEEEFGG